MTLLEDFRSIVLEARPLIDVRAPVEFDKGSFEGAVNLPLLDDNERALVGTRYKEAGNAAAVALGHELIGGAVKEARVAVWAEFARAHPEAYIYCFRGGQRSRIAQQWLGEAGIELPRIKGGYKAFRAFLSAEAERIAAQSSVRIIGGRTGSGKTLLLNRLRGSIDLEALANHRGSAFGKMSTPQPAQIDFENALAYALIRHEAQRHESLIIEHESYRIGRFFIPKPIYDAFLKGVLIVLECPLEERIEVVFEAYVTDLQRRMGERWFEAMLEALERIMKRLGHERYDHVRTQMHEAQKHQEAYGEADKHKIWIETLLCEYYDPMYDYQIERTTLPILFRGDARAVYDFLS
ncbi:MAG: tRNA 2-selenouridine(34) synthase MnmH [Campylobacterales bacterium]|nr:tRNA 2-selenouridine(34) synthase MnmH [Campylobacterales bacterium]